MPSASLALRGNANPGAAHSCTLSGTALQTVTGVMRAARGLWGPKTILFLQQLTGTSERTVRYWNAKQREPSASELVALLRTDDGLTFLSAVMADAKPLWWRTFKQQVAVADANRLALASRRRLQEAINADADLTQTIARAEALLAGDADFYRPHADAVGAVARAPYRPQAETKKRGR